ncbi:MAG: alpha/beta fold hydrolase [Candidatus Eremiobacterota bacterium]
MVADNLILGAEALPTDVRDLYPFTSHYRRESAQGARYHYLDEGRGEPILMVHGNPTWSFYYRDLIRAFWKTHRAVVPDHIGCGLSDKPQNYPYRLRQHIQNLEELVLDMNLKDITLVVHDWGGPIGLGVAARHPHRFKRLVVMNTAAFRSARMPWLLRIARLPLIGDVLIRGLNAFAGLAMRLAIARPDRLSDSARRGFLFPYRNWHDRVGNLRFVQDIPMEPGHPSYSTLVEVEEGMGRLTHLPTLLVWGEKDWVFTPEFLKRWMLLFPQCEVQRLSWAGHLVAQDASPEVIAFMKEFLA